MKISCLHTAQIHVATFSALFDRAGFAGQLDHVVRTDLLDRAREQGTAAVASDLRDVIGGMTDADAVLCTCSTLGPLIDALAADDARLLRIDRPLMERAAQAEGTILVAICLPSTQEATLDLLQATAHGSGRMVTSRVLLCAGAWPLFEAGDTDGFARSVASQVRDAVAADAQIGMIVLGQASMMGAAQYLTGVSVPVLSSPALAVDRAIEIARS